MLKIPVGKRCGFVQFANRSCAEEALKMLNGSQLGGQNIRLSWGRTPANKQPQQDPNQWNGSYYGYAQSYDTYGYAPPQDPNMYAYATYPGYGNYQQQPQQQRDGCESGCSTKCIWQWNFAACALERYTIRSFRHGGFVISVEDKSEKDKYV
uniref:RRM domain-containing protein n=1 Tax=Ananas comosus var. bracteatus TaxID=296719 RepID=A0A6V7PAU3_ANACO|nr:unnamed protein product [Ananas comosus var. bracteatus]